MVCALLYAFLCALLYAFLCALMFALVSASVDALFPCGKKLPVDFAADVEYGVGCLWFEFFACVLVADLLLEVFERLCLFRSE